MDPTLIAVGGTLAGTALGWVGAVLKDRWQREHEDARRWHDRRLDAYADLIAVVHAIERTANDVTLAVEDDDASARAAGIGQFTGQMAALWAAAALAELVASEQVETPAFEMRMATAAFVQGTVRDSRDPARAGELRGHHDQVATAMAVFVDAARAELGLR